MATTYTPAPTHAGSNETVPLDSIAIRTDSRVFDVRVPDDSLRAMALLPGDVVICEQGVTPGTGEVVAVFVDGTSVLRVWSLQVGRPVLRYADGEIAPVSAEDLMIQGVAGRYSAQRHPSCYRSPTT